MFFELKKTSSLERGNHEANKVSSLERQKSLKLICPLQNKPQITFLIKFFFRENGNLHQLLHSIFKNQFSNYIDFISNLDLSQRKIISQQSF